MPPRTYFIRDETPHYRRLFRKLYPLPPWPCNFCSGDITDGCGRHGQALAVHHWDEDHNNNDPSNLVAVHIGCHSRHHQEGRERTLEERVNQSIKMMGNKHLLGYRHNSEAIAKISRAGIGNQNARKKILHAA